MPCPFHLAIPVNDLNAAVNFYTCVLGCEQGRSRSQWVDLHFLGHQLVCHQTTSHTMQNTHNHVDGDSIPVPHFGVVLTMDTWQVLTKRFRSHRLSFIVEPRIRFAGQPGEQATCFIQDPSGNVLEFKAFANLENLFAS